MTPGEAANFDAVAARGPSLMTLFDTHGRPSVADLDRGPAPYLSETAQEIAE